MNATDHFLAILQAHKGIIYKVANAYCHDPEDRKDLVQEISVQLWRSFSSYNDAYQYSTWIYRIALNVAISFYRKERRRKEIASPLSEGILSLSDKEAPPENAEQLRLLQRFITELKELDKALLLLYLEEKSQKEIAEITGISVTNVSTRIARIKKLLQQKFSTLQK
ncbi:RNA polymerase sigma factor [Chitinophaga vietnamensis]|uniref:RNA polymerase sigma factor n=1 Tax=Chitinophaga vietnamensis TaxID=2593957 RepID=UPI0011775BDC|nr:sigma-70 family RNA polymerase sigma factor [Chitinophaga vietnamensis]